MTRRAHTAATALLVVLIGSGPASAASASIEGSFAGTTEAGAKVSFKVRAGKPRLVRGFAIGYRSECTDDERLKSTFRFYPTPLAKGRFAVSGSTSGTLADGRAFTSKVKLAGRFATARSATGSFRLTTRIPDPSGGVATCTTGLVRWTATRRSAN